MKGEEAVRVSRGGQPRVKIGRELKRGGERLNPCQSFEGLAVFVKSQEMLIFYGFLEIVSRSETTLS